MWAIVAMAFQEQVVVLGNCVYHKVVAMASLSSTNIWVKEKATTSGQTLKPISVEGKICRFVEKHRCIGMKLFHY